ncbi:MAG: beta-lactamase family protein [Leptospira sp.]|nr:beta-lactamase family protein [Leptospira sp.]
MLTLFFSINLIAQKKEKSPDPKVILKSSNRKIPYRDYWPTADWKTAIPEKQGINSAELAKVLDYCFARTGDDIDRKGIRTDGLLIVRGGYIVAEKYARGFTAERPHLVWSVSKSFVNALYGIAVKDGKMDLNEKAYRYFPELDSDSHKEISIDNILRMSSGIEWSEGYEASPLKSSVIAMLYTGGRNDMAKFTAGFPLAHTPGTFMYYSSGDSNLLMSILKNVYKERYATLPWERLFDRIGMKNVTWERDKSGTFVGSSYIYATPRDIAKFGQLYLNDGRWNNEKILPDGWVDYSVTTAPSFFTTPNYPKLEEYEMSAQWYTNFGDPKRSFPKPWPAAPSDTFAASGHWGQKIWVIPSLDLVIVRVADDRDDSFNENQFLKLLMQSIKK